jgi:hypothetical protein
MPIIVRLATIFFDACKAQSTLYLYTPIKIHLFIHQSIKTCHPELQQFFFKKLLYQVNEFYVEVLYDDGIKLFSSGPLKR